jgi:hypothetical protein
MDGDGLNMPSNDNLAKNMLNMKRKEIPVLLFLGRWSF